MKIDTKQEILKMSWFEHSKRIDELHRILPPNHPQIAKLKRALEKIKIEMK